MHRLNRFHRACGVAAFWLVSAWSGFSQSAPLPPATAEQAPAQPTSSEEILHATTNLVLVDVVVSRKGQMVHGLKQDQFQVFENGKPQKIATFEEHTSAVEPVASTTLAPLPLDTYSNRPVTPTTAGGPATVNVLLLDALNTPIGDQMQVRRQMLTYLKTIPAGTHMAIFTLASRLRMVTGFTQDAGLLAAAIANARNGPQPSVLLDQDSANSLASATSELASFGAGSDAVGSMQQFQADITAFQTDQRVEITMDTMQQLARYLSAIPGRKNLIWFSGSFPIALLADDTLPNPFQSSRYYSEELLDTDRLLSSARVAVYPVDARGLMTPAIFDVSKSTPSSLIGSSGSGSAGGRKRRGSGSSGMINGGSGLNKANQDANDQRLAEQASMQQIAGDTGGHAFWNNNDLAGALAKALDDGSNYYTIGYVPSSEHLDGKFHKLNVKIDGGNFETAYRPGFYADDPQHPRKHTTNVVGLASMMTAAALHGAPASTQIVFQVRVLPAEYPLVKAVRPADAASKPAGALSASLPAPIHRYAIDFRINGPDLTYTTSVDGVNHAQLEYAVIAFDSDSKRVNYSDNGYRINLKPGLFERVLKGGLPFHAELDLPQGAFSLRLAVHDLVADRVGSLEIPLIVPKDPKK